MTIAYMKLVSHYEDEFFKKELTKALDEKKLDLKQSVELAKSTLLMLIDATYKDRQNSAKNISNVYKLYQEQNSTEAKENFLKSFVTNDSFMAFVSKEYSYPEGVKLIDKKHSDNSREFVLLNNKKYFFVYKEIEDGLFGIAIDNEDIKKSYLKKFFRYLDAYNKDKNEYIGMGEMLTYEPKEDGIFGTIIYMPPSLSQYIGTPTTTHREDVKGKRFQNEYFEKFKNGENNFYIDYYFESPKSDIAEQKVSYFTLVKPYGYKLLKGFYASDVKKTIERVKSEINSKFKNLFQALAAGAIVAGLVGIILVLLISRKIILEIEKEYKKMKSHFEKSKKEILHNIYYDKLTLLPNRNRLVENVNKYKSLIIMDIDDFSIVNDIYGFELGDEVLVYISKLLKDRFENVYKLGSDEFAIAYHRSIGLIDLEKIAALDVRYKEIKINFNIGGSNKEDLFQTADMALRRAKEHKNYRFDIYSEDMFAKQKKKMEGIQFLKQILEHGEIFPYYQAIVDCDEIIIKYEALMRVKYEDKIYLPFYFLPLAKDIKFYNKFSQGMMQRAFEDVKSGKIDKMVSINLSFEDIRDEQTSQFLQSALTKEIASKITIEVLENDNIDSYQLLQEFLEKIKKNGAKVAIDDFGSGYSNYAQILEISPDFIKIDSSLVRKINDEKYLKIIKLIIEFCKDFDIKSIAEFVDNKKTFETLKDLGVDYFQGFYFHKPKSIDKL